MYQKTSQILRGINPVRLRALNKALCSWMLAKFAYGTQLGNSLGVGKNPSSSSFIFNDPKNQLRALMAIAVDDVGDSDSHVQPQEMKMLEDSFHKGH